jgi:hypothetical protein
MKLTKRIRPTIAGGALLLCIAASASAQVAEPAQGYNAFRLVRTRNIFDPERRAVRSEAPAARPQMTGSRSNFITLTGTMVTEGKNLAFFTGSRPEYSKVISLHDKIADFAITAIATSQVELELAGKAIVVGIGRQLPLDGSIAENTIAISPTPTDNAPPAAAEASPSSPPATNDKNDVLRRMMERRQKELSK